MTFLINEESETSLELDDAKLYLPNETINKLEIICSWFLKKEQNSELYNQNLEHCDVNHKLNYTNIRFEYLKYLLCYLKTNTVDVNANTSKTKTLTKMFHASSTNINGQTGNNGGSSSVNSTNGGPNSHEKHRLISSGFKHLRNQIHNLQNHTTKSPKTDRHQNFTAGVQKNLSSLMQEDSNTALVNKRLAMNGQKKKALEYIECFCENLNFCLRILKHEKSIITRIFKNSEETKHELLCNLTILIIDEIQTEFESFLTYGVDFKQVQNNGHQVVNAIIQLVIKIDKLKENTNDLQIFDIPCAAKLIQFSSSLREITSQILFYYLEAIKTGFGNTFIVPIDSSVHEYSQQTCEILRLLRTNEDILDGTIRILCENYFDKQTSSSVQNQGQEEDPIKYSGK
jgi:hypothetical protein